MTQKKSQSLEQEIERLRAVVDAIPGYVSWVSSDMTYLGANQQLLEALQLKSEEIHGRSVGFQSDDDFFTRFIQKFFASDKKTVSREMELHTLGESTWHLLVGYKYDEGKSAVFLGFDISELKRKERIILEQENQIHQSAKLSAIGEMAAGIVHEINNPLSVILANKEHLQHRLKKASQLDEKNIGILDKISGTVERIMRISRGLRKLAHGDSEHEPMEWVALDTVVQETKELAEVRTNQSGVELTVPLECQGRIYCRPTQLVQVLVNLLNNATDAISEFEHPWIRLEIEETEADIRFLVIDCGSGIPDEIKEQILQPFFTTKGVGKGTGLGLSISRGIINDHGGELLIETRDGHTCFIAQFPNRGE